MMTDTEKTQLEIEAGETSVAFDSFRALEAGANAGEADQLFRSMAQLFSYVWDKCDDGQVAQYDKILCQLADAVEQEARAHVAQLLAPLTRAPGRVVVRLAQDKIEVAKPLLEFSKVLSDDDLIEIVSGQSEEHRVAIAGRDTVNERVGDAIVTHGSGPSIARLVSNKSAQLGGGTLEKLAHRTANDDQLAAQLRGQENFDWERVRREVSDASSRVLDGYSFTGEKPGTETVARATTIVYQRVKNQLGFNAKEWRLAWNQVKALNDRRQLDAKALARFARFSYGHHAAAALTMILSVPGEVFVKWLSTQDYVAVTVALRALGLEPELVRDILPVLPWRDQISDGDVQSVMMRFEALSAEEARGIFRLWRAHAFRRKGSAAKEAVA